MNPRSGSPDAIALDAGIPGSDGGHLATDAPAQSSSPPPRPPAIPPGSHRLQSLDAYRGLIMLTLLAGGIFHSLKGVPGWNWLFLQNEHVEWAGCVYWDLIQPSFMFMVGA